MNWLYLLPAGLLNVAMPWVVLQLVNELGFRSGTRLAVVYGAIMIIAGIVGFKKGKRNVDQGN